MLLEILVPLYGGVITILYCLRHFISASSEAVQIAKGLKRESSFSKYLGLQDTIEKRLHCLLEYEIPKRSLATKKIILHVEDIDRCQPAKMLNIIESLRTLLENPEIQKRLIVVISIDSDKIEKAFKKADVCMDVKEQLDKIFLSGIKLPVLHKFDQLEYIRQLHKDSFSQMGEDITGTNGSQPQDNQEPQDTETNDGEEEDSTVQSTDLSKIRQWMESYFNEHEKELKDITPRRIRIIYYRLWFAHNLMVAKHHKTSIHKGLIESIIRISMSYTKTLNGELQYPDFEVDHIVEMVCPY